MQSDSPDRVSKEAEAREKEARDTQITPKTQKALFFPWSMEQIRDEAIDNPNVYWMEPVVSFDLDNSSES